MSMDHSPRGVRKIGRGRGGRDGKELVQPGAHLGQKNVPDMVGFNMHGEKKSTSFATFKRRMGPGFMGVIRQKKKQF